MIDAKTAHNHALGLHWAGALLQPFQHFFRPRRHMRPSPIAPSRARTQSSMLLASTRAQRGSLRASDRAADRPTAPARRRKRPCFLQQPCARRKAAQASNALAQTSQLPRPAPTAPRPQTRGVPPQARGVPLTTTPMACILPARRRDGARRRWPARSSHPHCTAPRGVPLPRACAAVGATRRCTTLAGPAYQAATACSRVRKPFGILRGRK